MSEACNLSCPICGEGDNFDQGGLVRHIDRYCERADQLRDEWAEWDQRDREASIRRITQPIADFAIAVRQYLMEQNHVE